MKYSVLVPYEFEAGDETKTGWTDVGVAFKTKSGGMTVLIRPGVSISGRVCILPPMKPAELDGAVKEAAGFKFTKMALSELI